MGIVVLCGRRVRGLKGLRVVDASVIPSSPSGDTYAVQVMIAEKTADHIRGKDTVLAIKEYFRHLYEVRHKKVMEEEEILAAQAADEKAAATEKTAGTAAGEAAEKKGKK